MRIAISIWDSIDTNREIKSDIVLCMSEELLANRISQTRCAAYVSMSTACVPSYSFRMELVLLLLLSPALIAERCAPWGEWTHIFCDLAAAPPPCKWRDGPRRHRETPSRPGTPGCSPPPEPAGCWSGFHSDIQHRIPGLQTGIH